MKVLIVCSGNKIETDQELFIRRPFVMEQFIGLKSHNIDADLFLIKGNCFGGYIKNIFKIRKLIKNHNYSILHAHYGFSGTTSFLASIGLKIKLIITYHGDDINSILSRVLFYPQLLFAYHSIFVSQTLLKKVKLNLKKFSVIPCGVDLNIFYPRDFRQSRSYFKMDLSKKYILFPSSKYNLGKNFALAKKIINRLINEGYNNLELVELDGYKREEVAILMNAVDLVILTSKSEGSPQVIKEALACNCPVVSTDVGDVKYVFGNLYGYEISSLKVKEFSEKVKKLLSIKENQIKLKGRERIIELGLDNETIIKKLIKIYEG